MSINFNNAAGKLGAGSVASSTRQATAEKIGWIREGAGDRFGDIELELAAYFVAISENPAKGRQYDRHAIELRRSCQTAVMTPRLCRPRLAP